MKQPGEEYWRFGCRRCKVHMIVCFPRGYGGSKTGQCPGCDLLMEVIEQPEAYRETEEKPKVTDMYSRRKAQLLAESISKHPGGKGTS